MKAVDIRKAMGDGTVLAYQTSPRYRPKPVVVVGEDTFGGSGWKVQHAETNERVYARDNWFYIPSRSLVGTYDEAIIAWETQRARKAKERAQEEALRVQRRERANEVVERMLIAIPELSRDDFTVVYEGTRIIVDFPEEN